MDVIEEFEKWALNAKGLAVDVSEKPPSEQARLELKSLADDYEIEAEQFAARRRAAIRALRRNEKL